MLESGKPRPVFGMNRGTVGFLMNDWRLDRLAERIEEAKAIRVAPLEMKARTVAGETYTRAAINEVSLLRETRQTAKIEVSVNGRAVIPGARLRRGAGCHPGRLDRLQSVRRGADPAAPAKMLALTAISPFRPRRWSGAILPDDTRSAFGCSIRRTGRCRRSPTSSRSATSPRST
jgi:NAD+ kinase